MGGWSGGLIVGRRRGRRGLRKEGRPRNVGEEEGREDERKSGDECA
jgi:hypothetical protein